MAPIKQLLGEEILLSEAVCQEIYKTGGLVNQYSHKELSKEERAYYREWYRKLLLKQRFDRYQTDPEFAAYQRAATRKSGTTNVRRKRRYGTDGSDIFAAQNNCCAICKGTEPKNGRTWCLDHDHKTGKVRGMLCHPCNLMLGYIQDNVTTLSNAILYLNKHKGE